MLSMTVSSHTTFLSPVFPTLLFFFLSFIGFHISTLCIKLTLNLSLLPHYSLRYVSSLDMKTSIKITFTDYKPDRLDSKRHNKLHHECRFSH